MYVPRVPVADMPHLTGHDEEDVSAGLPVSQIAGQKLLRVSVKAKTGRLRPHVRSFGHLSQLENTQCPTQTNSDPAKQEPFPQGLEVTDGKGRSEVELTMLALWEKCSQKGLFRYDVTKYQTTVMPGSHGFLLQLNDGRTFKKRTCEFLVDKVVQEFDEAKFNFTKALMKEVLFEFDTNAMNETVIDPSSLASSSPDLVMINFCPIEYGHVLLVPRILDKLPQNIDVNAMLLGLQFASAVSNPYFRLIYNSFGAYASINHLHFQGYFVMAPFPSERVPTSPIESAMFDGAFVMASELLNYPVRGWVFEMVGSFDESLKPLAEAVGHVCAKLQEMDVPHNMVVADCGARVLLWPQCFQEKQAKGLIPEDIVETNLMPAVSEIAGHVIVKRRQDFESFKQDDVWRLLALASLTTDRFAELTELCLKC